MPSLSARPLLRLDTGAVAAGGGCVARAADGRVVFVRHALPGEKVLVAVTAETSSFLRGDAVEVMEPSPDRVAPPCRYAGPDRCGGCDWQHVTMPAQRRLKADLVGQQLRRLAGVDRQVEVEEVVGTPDGLGWRTRVRYGIDDQGRVGLRKHRSHDLELVDRCLIASPGVDAVAATRYLWPDHSEVEVAASSDGTERVVSVSNPARGVGQGRGNRRPAPPTSFPRGDFGLVVDGHRMRDPTHIHHTVLGRRYRVTAGVFWQVHPGAAQALARAVLDGLGPETNESAVDLYAGAGLFSALLGEAVGATGSVVAVESDPSASADAAHNTADQGQVRVVASSVDNAVIDNAVIDNAVIDNAVVSSQIERPDLVVLDPPRAGTSRVVTDWLIRSRPRRVAYVACDPASFARDVRRLLDAGWTMPSLRAFDLFPMTEHVELVAVLEPHLR